MSVLVSKENKEMSITIYNSSPHSQGRGAGIVSAAAQAAFGRLPGCPPLNTVQRAAGCGLLAEPAGSRMPLPTAADVADSV